MEKAICLHVCCGGGINNSNTNNVFRENKAVKVFFTPLTSSLNRFETQTRMIDLKEPSNDLMMKAGTANITDK